jgi:hypothetical protein
MSWEWKVIVECDACHRAIEVEARKGSEVERAMNRRGWVVSDEGRDLCEDCCMDGPRTDEWLNEAGADR